LLRINVEELCAKEGMRNENCLSASLMSSFGSGLTMGIWAIQPSPRPRGLPSIRCGLQELGNGHFGVVKKGRLRQVNATDSTRTKIVAVKQLKPEYNEAADLKNLLDELKVMTALGTHVNIVQLIGAVTKRIQEGEFYIVMELCERGSLLDVLKEMSSLLQTANSIRNGCDSSIPLLSKQALEVNSETLHTHLVLYGYQIANGMVFISNKNVRI
jgi:hypothetical protein